MNKNIENIILGGIAVGLAIAVSVLTSEVSHHARYSTGEEDVEDLKADIKKQYKDVGKKNVNRRYRKDVYTAVYNRVLDQIELEAADEDKEELYEYNDELFNHYV